MRTIKALLIIFNLVSSLSYAGEGVTSVDIHGFISQGYLKTDHNNYLAQSEKGSFQFNEMALNFGTDLTENLRFGCQFFGIWAKTETTR